MRAPRVASARARVSGLASEFFFSAPRARVVGFARGFARGSRRVRRGARRGVARVARAITTAPVSLTAQTPLAKSKSYLTRAAADATAHATRSGAGAPPRSEASKASAHLLGAAFSALRSRTHASAGWLLG